MDRPLLEIFQRQIPEKVKKALEPFGFYDAQVSTTMEKIEKEEALVRVKVMPGEPIRVAAVNVRVTGPGEQNPDLKLLVDSFPLRVGMCCTRSNTKKRKKR